MSTGTPPSISSRTTVYLDQPPCCMQFVPDLPDLFVVGTYQYNEPSNETSDPEKGTRTGSLVLFPSDEFSL